MFRFLQETKVSHSREKYIIYNIRNKIKDRAINFALSLFLREPPLGKKFFSTFISVVFHIATISLLMLSYLLNCCEKNNSPQFINQPSPTIKIWDTAKILRFGANFLYFLILIATYIQKRIKA